MKPGIHQISMQEYLQIKALSSGLCNTLLAYSPAHAKYEQENGGSDPSPESDIGIAIHDALLEGFDRIVSVAADDWRTKAAKDARDAARAAGKIPLLAHKVPQIQGAVDAALNHVEGSELSGIFRRGKPEQTIVWKEGAVLCKARPDWLTDERDVMLHVKSTSGSAEPSAWIRNQLTPAGYDLAALFYERAIEQHVDANTTLTVFLVVEQNPPHGCSLVALSPAMAELAARKVARAISIWQDCHAKNEWPCYSSQIAYADPPPWQLAAWEEREMILQYEHDQKKAPDTIPYGEQA